MADAKIGALHVSLGLDSAQFTAGLKQAEAGLGKFSKMTGLVVTAAAAAAASAAFAIGHAVKAAANHADELGKVAQKVGVSVEALSRLEYAAKLSDVSLEGLTTGLRKFSQEIVTAAGDAESKGARAFRALGVDLVDASGKLRSTDSIFEDVADRFSRIEDSAIKTTLAVQMFGKSGADLIPLLNSGRAGLAGMAAEADRLGVTINNKTAKAAETFNDNLTRLNAVSEGLSNKIMEALIPSLANLSDKMASQDFQQAIITTTQLVAGLGGVLLDAARWAGALLDVLPKALGANEDDAVNKRDPSLVLNWETLGGHPLGASSRGRGRGGRRGKGTPATTIDDETIEIDLADLTGGIASTTEVIDPFAARIAELRDVLTETHDPFEQMKLDLTDLETMWKHGRISTEQYGAAVQRVNLNAAATTLGMASQISGALAGLFKDNKAFAIANAVINTAEGVTKAFAQGGMWAWPSAIAIGLSGAAQVASIFAAEPGSASVVSPSAASSPEAATSTPAGASDGQGVTIRLPKKTIFSRDDLLDLFDQLKEAAGDRGISSLVLA